MLLKYCGAKRERRPLPLLNNMKKELKKIKQNKKQRQTRVRFKISGTGSRPRLSVFRSNRGLYLQLINDERNKTIVSVNAKEVKDKGTKKELSALAGKLLAQKAMEQGIKEAVFDRGGNKYHGRIKAVAEAAREAGLKI